VEISFAKGCLGIKTESDEGFISYLLNIL